MTTKNTFKRLFKYLIIIITIIGAIILFSSIYIFICGGPIYIPLANKTKISIEGISLIPPSIEYLKIALPNYHLTIDLEKISLAERKLKLKNLLITYSTQEKHVSTPKDERKQESAPYNWQKPIEYLHYLNIDEISIENVSLYLKFQNNSHLKITNIKIDSNLQNNNIKITGGNIVGELTVSEKKEELTGILQLSCSISENDILVNIAKCELENNEVRASIQFNSKLYPKNIKIDELILKGKLLNFFLTNFITQNCSAEKIELKELEFKFTEDNPFQIETSKGKVAIPSFVLGSAELPFLSIGLFMQWNCEPSQQDSASQINSTITLNNWEMKVEGVVNRNLNYEFKSKCKGNIKSLRTISPFYFSSLPLLSIEEEKIEILSNIKGDKNLFEGIIETITFSTSSKDKIELLSTIKGKLDNILSTPELEFKGELKFPKKSASFILQTKGTFIEGKVNSEDFPTSELINILLPNYDYQIFKMFNTSGELSFNGNLSQDINFTAKGGTYTLSGEDLLPIAPAEWETEGILSNLSYLKGKFKFSSENALNIMLKDFYINILPLKISSPFLFRLYFSNIDPSFAGIPITGLLKTEGKLNWSIDKPLKLDFTSTIEGFGYPPYFFPENLTTCSKGTLEYDFLSSKVIIPNLEIGLNNYYFSSIDNCYLYLTSNSTNTYPTLSIDSFILDIESGSLPKNETIAIDKGTISLKFQGIEFRNGEITFNKHLGKIESLSLEIPSYKLKLDNVNAEFTNISNNTIIYNLTADNLLLYGISISSAKMNGEFQPSPLKLLIKDVSTTLWNGEIKSKGSIYKKENSILCNFSSKINNIDLKHFTEEVQPPWLKLTGIGDGSFELLFDFSKFELVEGDFSLLCNEGITINRDLLLKLILYLQNVKVVEKRLQKLLGDEDPKKFQYAELNVGYKDRKATVAVLLSTKDLELAPIIYINADWKQLISLLVMPSNFEIEIK